MTLLVALWAITALTLTHTAIYTATATWHTTNINLTWQNPTHHHHRTTNPAWYIRYTNHLTPRKAKR